MTVTTSDGARVLDRSQHSISRKNIHENALKVLRRLDRAGHKGYLVGGAVRDLLLGREPKDYDVATDARPTEVRRLFRNSRIIGRRFRLAHIYFREGVIEVATFRRDPDPASQASAPGELLITDDNVYGTPEQDAFRRDFTVNALFYDISNFSVIDYVGGIEDLEGRQIRAIGEPEIRFQEDPVRMTRACEIAGRLDFTIEKQTQLGILSQSREILKAATPRLTDEVLQILRSRRAGATMQWMLDLGLVELILPEAAAMVRAGDQTLGSFGEVLPALDRMISSGTEVSDPALFSVVLLPAVLERRFAVEERLGSAMSRGALASLIEETIAPFFTRFMLSQLKAQQVTHTFLAFHRLADSRWRPGERLRFARQAAFDDALTLLEVLVTATGEGEKELEVWRRVASKRPPRRKKEGQARRSRPRRRRRRRRR